MSFQIECWWHLPVRYFWNSPPPSSLSDRSLYSGSLLPEYPFIFKSFIREGTSQNLFLHPICCFPGSKPKSDLESSHLCTISCGTVSIFSSVNSISLQLLLKELNLFTVMGLSWYLHFSSDLLDSGTRYTPFLHLVVIGISHIISSMLMLVAVGCTPPLPTDIPTFVAFPFIPLSVPPLYLPPSQSLPCTSLNFRLWSCYPLMRCNGKLMRFSVLKIVRFPSFPVIQKWWAQPEAAVRNF